MTAKHHNAMLSVLLTAALMPAFSQTVQFRSDSLAAAYSGATQTGGVAIEVFDVVDTGLGATTWAYLIYQTCERIPPPGINQCLTAQGFIRSSWCRMMAGNTSR
jgi:hypothetical protein